MKNEEERLEQLIREKKFEELTVEEKELVFQMLGSEEEFETMRKIETSIETRDFKSTLQPDPEVLISLKYKMRREKEGASVWNNLLAIKIPMYAAALVVVFFSGAIFLFRAPSAAKQSMVGSPIIKSDTIFITKTDTVFKEKVIYRQVSQVTVPPKQIESISVAEKTTSVSRGVSMKEKEELNKLLVSGSE